jgi:hypothetical protein
VRVRDSAAWHAKPHLPQETFGRGKKFKRGQALQLQTQGRSIAAHLHHKERNPD